MRLQTSSCRYHGFVLQLWSTLHNGMERLMLRSIAVGDGLKVDADTVLICGSRAFHAGQTFSSVLLRHGLTLEATQREGLYLSWSTPQFDFSMDR